MGWFIFGGYTFVVIHLMNLVTPINTPNYRNWQVVSVLWPLGVYVCLMSWAIWMTCIPWAYLYAISKEGGFNGSKAERYLDAVAKWRDNSFVLYPLLPPRNNYSIRKGHI